MFGILRNTLRQEAGPQNAVRCAWKQRFELSHSASSVFLVICANSDVYMLMRVNSQWLYYAKNTFFFFPLLCSDAFFLIFLCFVNADVCFVKFSSSKDRIASGWGHNRFQLYCSMFLSCQCHFQQKNLLSNVNWQIISLYQLYLLGNAHRFVRDRSWRMSGCLKQTWSRQAARFF